MLVQTGAITANIQNRRSPHIAITVLALAMEIPEEIIPDDLEMAADSYVEWQYHVRLPGQAGWEAPEWMQEWESNRYAQS
jgi:hypothetical protein